MLNRRLFTPPPPVSVANGVYLQDIKGNFYKKGAYYGGVPLNGVAVISDDLSIVGSVWALAHSQFIYPDKAADATIKEGTSLVGGISLWGNIPIFASVAEARSGLDGSSLTTLLSNNVNGKTISVFNYPDIDTYTVSVSAMQYCSSYTFPSGATGWLPSVSELELWLSHAQEITELLEDVSSRLFGGLYYYGTTDIDDFGDEFVHSYWTSSRASNKSVTSFESLVSTSYVQYYRSLVDSLDFTPAVITTEYSPDYYYRPFTSIEVPAVGVPQSECTISLYRGVLRASQPVASDVTVVVRYYEAGGWRMGSYVIPSGKTDVYWGNGIIGGENISVPYLYPSYDWKYNYVLGALE